METNHKEFKPFDKVLVRWEDVPGKYTPWEPNLFSRVDEDGFYKTIDGRHCLQSDILLYEGNEELVGTTDEPEEEVKLGMGEFIMVADHITYFPYLIECRTFYSIRGNRISALSDYNGSVTCWNYAIKLSDFNPNDMEETRKHILCAKNGRIVKYHGKD